MTDSAPKLGSPENPVQHGTFESPIKVEESRYERRQYLHWEQKYIDGRTTLSRMVRQKIHNPAPGKYIDEITVKECNGTVNVFWFDVSDALNASMKVMEHAARELGIPPDLMK